MATATLTLVQDGNSLRAGYGTGAYGRGGYGLAASQAKAVVAVHASAAPVQPGNTLAASATVLVAATGASLQASDTGAASALVAVQASLAQVQDGQLLEADGRVEADPRRAWADLVQDDQALASRIGASPRHG